MHQESSPQVSGRKSLRRKATYADFTWLPLPSSTPSKLFDSILSVDLDAAFAALLFRLLRVDFEQVLRRPIETTAFIKEGLDSPRTGQSK
jgi:hypothetical protein